MRCNTSIITLVSSLGKPADDPNDFFSVIKAKENAPDRLRRALMSRHKNGLPCPGLYGITYPWTRSFLYPRVGKATTCLYYQYISPQALTWILFFRLPRSQKSIDYWTSLKAWLRRRPCGATEGTIIPGAIVVAIIA